MRWLDRLSGLVAFVCDDDWTIRMELIDRIVLLLLLLTDRSGSISSNDDDDDRSLIRRLDVVVDDGVVYLHTPVIL